MYLLLVLVAITGQTAFATPVDCPFTQNGCKCFFDYYGPPKTFTRVVCRISSNQFLPFNSSVGDYTVAGEFIIQSEGYDIKVPANAFLAFHSIATLSFSTVGTQKVQFHPNALNGPQINAFTTFLFDGLFPLPEPVRQLGRNGLSKLSIEYANASTLDDNQFRDFKNLTTLEIENNQLRSLSDKTFAGLEQTLTKLSLTGNKLPIYPDKALNRLVKLQQLDLSENQLQTIPRDVFSKFPDLVSATMDKNSISKLSRGDFPQNNKLTYLSLNNNPITSIEKGAFSPLTNLQTVLFSQTKITSLDLSAFQELEHLQTIITESPKLKNLNISDQIPPGLELLDLSYSSIEAIDVKVAELLTRPNFKLLNLLSSTNLLCDDNITWIAKYVLCQPIRINTVGAACQNLAKSLDDYLREAVPNPCQ